MKFHGSRGTATGAHKVFDTWSAIETQPKSEGIPAQHLSDSVPDLRGRVLHVTIHQVQQSVPTEVICEVFSAYGEVAEMFQSPPLHSHTQTSSLFIEYEHGKMADKALHALHGEYLYPHDCQLDIRHATLKELHTFYGYSAPRFSEDQLQLLQLIQIDLEAIRQSANCGMTKVNMGTDLAPTPPSQHNLSDEVHPACVPECMEDQHTELVHKQHEHQLKHSPSQLRFELESLHIPAGIIMDVESAIEEGNIGNLDLVPHQWPREHEQLQDSSSALFATLNVATLILHKDDSENDDQMENLFSVGVLVEPDYGLSDIVIAPVPQVLDNTPVMTLADPGDDTPQDAQGILSMVEIQLTIINNDFANTLEPVAALQQSMIERFRTLQRASLSPIFEEVCMSLAAKRQHLVKLDIKPGMSLELHLLFHAIRRNEVVLWPISESSSRKIILLQPWDPVLPLFCMNNKAQSSWELSILILTLAICARYTAGSWCYLETLHYIHGSTNQAISHWDMHIASSETWMLMYCYYARVHSQWNIAVKNNNRYRRFYAILHERAEVKQHYSCLSVLTDVDHKGCISRHIRRGTHFSGLVEWLLLQSEFGCRVLGNILLYCVFKQWDISWTVSLVSLKFRFQYCIAERESVYGPENYQGTIAWSLGYYFSLLSLWTLSSCDSSEFRIRGMVNPWELSFCWYPPPRLYQMTLKESNPFSAVNHFGVGLLNTCLLQYYLVFCFNGHISQYGFKVIQWKIAWSLNLQHSSGGIQFTQLSYTKMVQASLLPDCCLSYTPTNGGCHYLTSGKEVRRPLRSCIFLRDSGVLNCVYKFEESNTEWSTREATFSARLGTWDESTVLISLPMEPTLGTAMSEEENASLETDESITSDWINPQEWKEQQNVFKAKFPQHAKSNCDTWDPGITVYRTFQPDSDTHLIDFTCQWTKFTNRVVGHHYKIFACLLHSQLMSWIMKLWIISFMPP